MYNCDSGYKLVGNSMVTCMNSGEWSPLPQCSPESSTESETKSSTESKTESTIESTTSETTVKFSTDFRHKAASKEQLSSTVIAEQTAESMPKSTGTTEINLLMVVAPLFFILLALLFLIVAIRYKIKLKVGREHGFQREQVRHDQILNDLKQTGEPLLPLDRKQDSAFSLVSVATLKQNRNRIF